MLFKEYLEQINKYAEEHPETLELELLEYNRGDFVYSKLLFKPSIGYYIHDNLILQEDFNDYNEIEEDYRCKIDSICVNYGG